MPKIFFPSVPRRFFKRGERLRSSHEKRVVLKVVHFKTRMDQDEAVDPWISPLAADETAPLVKGNEEV